MLQKQAIKEKSNVQSLERALAILDKLSEKPNGCSIKYLSEATKLNKSTVHRLLHTLIKCGYARQDAKSDLYYLGMRILELSSNMIHNTDIVHIAKPFIRNLCHETGQVIQLTIRSDNYAVFIDKVENPRQVVRMYSQIGKSIPVYCSSSGKALLAWEPDEEILNVINSIEFVQYTDTTICNKESLLNQLQDIRKKGYATDWFEHEEDICCIAAPIFNSNNQTVAAICLAGTMLQINSSVLANYACKVNETARLISRELGCLNYPAVFDQKMAEKDAEAFNNIVKRKYSIKK
ncbi:MAG: IclR family transcriptional regulator [Bacillota bacterium]